MNILLVDDHIIVREGVRRLLQSLPGTTLREAADGAGALKQYREQSADIVVLDLNLEGLGGLEVLRRLLAYDPNSRVIIFSMHAEPLYASRALKLGAKGYVSKSAGADELVTAIKKVAAGGVYIERSISSHLTSMTDGAEDPLHRLSSREIEILRHLGAGKGLSEIAETLGVSYKTIANTCSLMKNKLGLNRTADLIRISIELLQG